MNICRSFVQALTLFVVLAGATMSAQGVTRLSEWPDGSEFHPESAIFVISPDGRWVAFIGRDFWLKNVASGALDLLATFSIAPAMVSFSADSVSIMMAQRDGALTRLLLFDVTSKQQSFSLLPPDAVGNRSLAAVSVDTRWLVYGGAGSLMMYDRITRADLTIPGGPATSRPAISDDGRRVAFLRKDSQFDPARIFVYDRLTAATEAVDIGHPSLEGRSAVFNVLMSGDGRYVLFESDSRNLVAGAAGANLFLLDRFTQRIIQVNGQRGASDFATSMASDSLRVAFAGVPILPRAPVPFGGCLPIYLSSVDEDGDGMQDDWERLVGLSPSTAGDGRDDADADGLTNAHAFRAGLQPLARFRFRTRGPIDPEKARLTVQNRNSTPALLWLRLVDLQNRWSASAISIPAHSTREITLTEIADRPRDPLVMHLHSDVLLYPRLAQ